MVNPRGLALLVVFFLRNFKRYLLLGMILRWIILFPFVSHVCSCSVWFSLSLQTVRTDVTGLSTLVTDWCSLPITSIGCWLGTNQVGWFWWCQPSWCSFMTSSFLVPVPRWSWACWLGPYPCGYRSRRYSHSVLYLRLTCTHVVSHGIFDL